MINDYHIIKDSGLQLSAISDINHIKNKVKDTQWEKSFSRIYEYRISCEITVNKEVGNPVMIFLSEF